MAMLKPGDPCPCCGEPIKTDDPFLLKILTDIADHKIDFISLDEVRAILEGGGSADGDDLDAGHG